MSAGTTEMRAPRGGRDAPVRLLRVEHETRYHYDDDMEIAHHLGHLRPRETPWQRVSDWRLVIDPPPQDTPSPERDGTGGPIPGGVPGHADTSPGNDEAAPPGARLSLDSWGNWRVAFSHATVHEHLVVRSSFVAALAMRPEPDARASPPWERVAAAFAYRPKAPFEPASEFALPSRLAPRAPELEALAREAFGPRSTLAAGATALMRLVHRSFAYTPAATSVNTVATESLALRKGVCQDFAHVMIGAMRSLGLSARYVSGYLLTHPAPGRPRLVGADATHAWVEAWCPVNGWIGLDPTNDVFAGQDHVTVAWGRDYSDVAPLRGIIRGGGRVEPTVAVTVQPVDARAFED